MELLPTYKCLLITPRENNVWFSFNNLDIGINDVFDPNDNKLVIDDIFNDINDFPHHFVKRTKQDN